MYANTKNTKVNTNGKNVWTLFLFLLAGIVLGGFLGSTLGQLPYLSWLLYSDNFGTESPLFIDFGILVIQFGVLIKFNIGAIIGMVISIFLYRIL